MALIEQLVAHAKGKQQLRRSNNKRLRQAVHRHRPISKQGIQERLFTLAFSGLVYPQIWEDPLVDLEALSLKEGEHLVAIASGGCNILSYLTAAPIRITAIDLNPAHVALNKLKLAAIRHLDYRALHRFFAEADARENVDVYEDYIRPHLDETSRRYWEARDLLVVGGLAISAPTFIGTACWVPSLVRAICWRGCMAATPEKSSQPRASKSSEGSSRASSLLFSRSDTSAGCSTSRRPCSGSVFRHHSSRP
jgi:hypothetical protein